ncbi:LytR family transcriptional regulator [bacterium]|nr:LytR family transcriptional regulator [bacterium]
MIDFQEKMNIDEGNFQEEDYKKPNKIKKAFKIISYLTVFVLIGFFIFSKTVSMSSQNSDGWFSDMSFWGTIKHLTNADDRKLPGSKEDRINILLAGVGGEGHDGGQLTDTIILASLKPSTKEVAMISFPRDMYIPWKDQWIKINSINAYSESKNPGSGIEELSSALENILDLNIHYYAKIDFEGFVKIIDELGGVEIYVDNAFDDYKYPIKGEEENPDYNSRFEHLHIEEGLQNMDGELALKYARSRHALGIEGSDFARAKRQQKILEAVKNELFSAYNILKPNLINRLIKTINNNFKTNIGIAQMIEIWNTFKDIERDNIINVVFDDGPNNYLRAGRSEQGAYMLIPKTGNYNEIKNLINNIFPEVTELDKIEAVKNQAESEDGTNNSQKTLEGDGEIINNKNDFSDINVEILNGTKISGLAKSNADGLKKYDINVINIDNSPQVNPEKTIIYDLSYGEKQEALSFLLENLNAISSISLPEWLIEYIKLEVEENSSKIKPDFIIILGNKQ